MWQDQQVAHSLDLKPRTDDVLTTETVTFEELLLSERILSGLKKSGFYKPSPIQLKAIPLGRCGLDLVVQAKSGTGKTCVFSVIALESINTSSFSLQVVVLAPTREIALQIQGVIACIGQDIPGLSAQAFIGGTLVSDDRIKAKKCHIAIGSPGRIKQLIELGILVTCNVQMFVLDEADKLVEEGNFQQQINWIYSSLPESKQVIALSATYPNTLAEFLTRYMREPTYARLDSSDQPLLGLRQYYVEVKDCSLPHLLFERKLEEMLRLLSGSTYQQALIFSNYHSKAESACDALNSYGWPATYVSGNMTQSRRIEAINKLKLYECRILLSTDLTSRGIDARNVDLVINLDLPNDWETYMHRIGRAGRFGSRGMAISLVSAEEEARLQSWISHRHAPIFLMDEVSNHNGELQSRDAKSRDKDGSSTADLNDIQLRTGQESPIGDETSQDSTQRHNNVNAINKNVDAFNDDASSVVTSNSEETTDTSSEDSIQSRPCVNMTDSFPYRAVNQERSLPLIPSLIDLKKRSWHFRTDTHYLQMNYDQLKADYDYFNRTHQFAKPDASPHAHLSFKMEELKIDVVEDDTKETADTHITEGDDGAFLMKSNTTELPLGSEVATFTTSTESKKSNEKVLNETLSTGLPGATLSGTKPTAQTSTHKNNSFNLNLQPTLVRRRNPLCAAAAIDILKHWTSVEKLSASKSQTYSLDKENRKTSASAVTSKSASSTRLPSSCYVIPARRNTLPDNCNNNQEGKVNLRSQPHVSSTNAKFSDKVALDSSTSDESSLDSDESYSDESSGEYTEDDSVSSSSSETSLTSDDGRKYGPGIGRWQPVDHSSHPTSQNTHPIFPPPLLFPFTPTGHDFIPAMHPYADPKAAQEAYISHQVYQFALQHARKQVSNL